MNKYLEKAAKILASDRVQAALKSRIRVKGHDIAHSAMGHGLTTVKDEIQKRAGIPAISKGFKFTPSSSGVAKTKPKLPEASKTLSPPKAVEQKVRNSNKTLVKSSAILDKVLAGAKSTAKFGKNTALGTAESISSSTKNIAQHAGGKKMRDFASSSLGKNHPSSRESFMRLSDSEKLKSVSNPKTESELKKLIHKRDASQAASTVFLTAGATGAVVGGKKARKKLEERKIQKQQEAALRQYYYQRGYR